MRYFVFFLVFCILLFPVCNLFLHIEMGVPQWDPFILLVLKGASIQTGLSLLVTLVFSLLGGFGFLFLRKKFSAKVFKVIAFVSLVPAFLPPLMVVIFASRAINYFPTGLYGVVFFHSVMNIGLVSLFFYQVLQKRTQLWSRDALVAGVPAWRFVFFGLVPEFYKDIVEIAAYLVLLYFFSFSIPFLVGGTIYGGIEVYLYEQVFLLGNWGQTIYYTLGLSIIVFALFSLSGLNRIRSSVKDDYDLTAKYLAAPGLALLALFPSVLLAFGLIECIFFAIQHRAFEIWSPEIRGTLVVGILTGLFVFTLLSALSFSYLKALYGRLVLAMINPGWVVVGFSFLLLQTNTAGVRIIFIALGLCIVYLPFLYRLSLHRSLAEMALQMSLAQTFPVSWNHCFWQVLYPQVLPQIALLSGLAAVWACGDFAMTSMLLDPTQGSTLGFEMKRLLSSYRLEAAILLVIPLLICSFVVFSLFQGIYYVSRTKTLS